MLVPDTLIHATAAAVRSISRWLRCRFIDLPDGTQGRVIYSGTSVFDQSQDALLYRRDLSISGRIRDTYWPRSQPAMLFGDLQLNAATFIA